MPESAPAAEPELDERFATGELDPAVWLPYYLPHWGTRAGSAATWGIGPDGLVLRIPAEQPLWAPNQHPEPLRVSCIQSGERDGQQPFLALQQVRRLAQSPGYPVQLMIGVFDFPAKARADDLVEPELVVGGVRGAPLVEG